MKHKCDGCKYKGEHQEMGFRPFNVCTKGINLIEAEKAYKADKCPFKKTNFDRIKAMSVEEMANFIRGLIQAHLNLFSNEMGLGGYILTAEENKEVEIKWKKWLESEVQEE